ncbi:MAG: hypothetical protein ACRBBN_09290 [Methyloligellaceae bacterium]
MKLKAATRVGFAVGVVYESNVEAGAIVKSGVGNSNIQFDLEMRILYFFESEIL